MLKSLINTGKGLDYTKAIGNVTALYKQAIGGSSNEVQIPLPQAEKPRIRPDELTDVQIEAALAPLFDYFDAQLPTLNTYLSDSAKDNVMRKIWKEILNTVESLLIPPLSEVQSDLKPLTDKEVDIVFKWLKVCMNGSTRWRMLIRRYLSSSETTSILAVKGQCQSRNYRIRSSATSCLFDCTMIGTRSYFSVKCS